MGELAGALVVGVSLIYVASQVRLANRISKAEAWRAIATTSAQIATAQAEDATFRRAFHKMYVQRAGRDQLDPDERISLGLWLGAQLSLLEQIHREVELGVLPREAYQTAGDQIFRLEYFAETWPFLAANHSVSFRAYMERTYDLSSSGLADVDEA